MKTKLVLTLFIIFALFLTGSSRGAAQGDVSSAALGTAITYQGRLADGGAAANTTYDFRFTLYNAEVGGAQVGSLVTVGDVPVSDGYFTVQLDFGAGAFGNAARWLEVAVHPGASTGAYTVLSPRQQLTPAPSALYAPTAGSVPWSGLTGVPAGFADGVDNIGTAGTGLDLSGGQFSLNAAYRLPQGCSSNQVPKWNGSTWFCAADNNTTNCWSLTGNTGTNPATNYLGTSNNTAFELRVNATRVLRLEIASGTFGSAPNLIGGYSANWITNGVLGATLFGGGNDSFLGSLPNRVTDIYGTVSGGYSNQAGDNASTVVNAAFATVGGGDGNTASGSYATIGGGDRNTASGENTTVCGGMGNEATDDRATIGGGSGNTASSIAVVGGGVANTAASGATVGGGYWNAANGNDSTIAGGSGNTAGGRGATIGGGGEYLSSGNIAGGDYATIPGGAYNIANGNYSFAAGERAVASQDGTFVWADTTPVNYHPFSYITPGGGTNSFNVRAVGGVYLATAVGTFGVPMAGMYLSAGGSGWNAYSDPATKMNFRTVNSLELLERLANIPISSWSYKSQDASIRHIGPMAQDFNNAFGVGEADKSGDKKYINSIDADGVALAAIQGLYQLNQEQAAEIQSLKAQLSRMETSGTPHSTSSMPLIWVVVALLVIAQGGMFLALRRKMGGRL